MREAIAMNSVNRKNGEVNVMQERPRFIRTSVRALLAAVCLGGGVVDVSAAEDDRKADWNFFTHAEGRVNALHELQGKRNYAELGESSLVLTGSVHKNLTFLFEGAYQPKRYRAETLTVERWQLQRRILPNHVLKIGKSHTPVSYWNTNYFHGRFFYPTSARPLSADKIIPMHDNAIGLSGRAIGQRGFFYELELGSGQASENGFFKDGVESSTVLGGFQSVAGNVTSLGWHRNRQHVVGETHDFGHPNQHHHSHDHDDHAMHARMAMPSQFEVIDILTASSFQTRGRVTFLTELALSAGSNDTENNKAAFQYVGYQYTDTLTPYVFADWLSTDRGNTFKRGIESKLGVGVNIHMGTAAIVKLELLRHRDGSLADTRSGIGAVVQVSVAL